jgi:hypothetical protein
MTLPNFLIIGAAKCGTTSLYHYLRQHPDIFMSPIKEPNYYTDDDQLLKNPAIRTRKAYEQLFARSQGERAIGEATPRYLNCITGIGRIHDDLPVVRLIVSLRQPAERAYSSYLGFRSGGRERRVPEEALQSGSYTFESSFYYPRLRRFYDRFPREHIRVILFDDLVAYPQDVVRDLFRFLDVDPAFPVNTTVRHNAGAVPRFERLNRFVTTGLRVVRPLAPQWLLSKGLSSLLRRPLLRKPEPLSPDLHRHLTDQYRDDILATGELIGRDLSHWFAEPEEKGFAPRRGGAERFDLAMKIEA